MRRPRRHGGCSTERVAPAGMPIRSSFDDAAIAEAALEAQAPLVESLRRYAIAASQLAVTSLIATASGLVWLTGAADALPFAIAGGIATVGFGLRLALDAMDRRARALDLIVAGGAAVPIPVVERELSRLLDPHIGAPSRTPTRRSIGRRVRTDAWRTGPASRSCPTSSRRSDPSCRRSPACCAPIALGARGGRGRAPAVRTRIVALRIRRRSASRRPRPRRVPAQVRERRPDPGGGTCTGRPSGGLSGSAPGLSAARSGPGRAPRA